ncbi:MAG: hypothetical protein A3J76_01770 [Candidatus Moranbacteria bacterium RBG_13_45_13]|nr:MAG: hypothetical protein A3J76_01770 [Candidatus Moranbacteria bacterium RBG_13_45_13]
MGAQPQAPQAPVQQATPPPPPMPPVQGPPTGQPGQIPPAQKKSHAWIWILGGCLGIVILIGIAIVALGWWGARKAKRELEKLQPNLEEMKKNADQWSKESEEWQKKSQELQENLPNPEDMPVPGNYPSQ